MISPADKENFIKTIIEKSPHIQLDQELRKYTPLSWNLLFSQEILIRYGYILRGHIREKRGR
jgi:hypothetical protein